MIAIYSLRAVSHIRGARTLMSVKKLIFSENDREHTLLISV